MKKAPAGSDRRQTVLALVGISVLGAALRVLHLLQQSRELPFVHQPLLDGAVYHDWARGILSGAEVFTGPFYQSPGYPYFLAAAYRILGVNPWSGVILQSVLGVATLILTVLLGKRIFDLRTGVIAGILVAGVGPLYFFEAKLLGTTLAVFLSTLAVYLMVLAQGNSRLTRGGIFLFAGAGVSTGLLAVVRSNMILVALLFALYLLWTAVRGGRPWWRLWAFSGAVLLVLLPSLAHNISRGSFSPLVTSGGFNFYMGNFRDANGLFKDVPGTTGRIETQEAEAEALVFADLGHGLSPAAESRYWLGRGLKEIASNPLAWLGLEGKKAWLLVDPAEETINGSYNLERDRVPVLRIAAIPFNLLVGAALVGLVLAAGWFGVSRGAKTSLAGPVSILGAVLLSGLLFFVMARLRLPAVPMLAVLGGYALVRATDAWRSGHRLAPAVLAGAVLAFTAATWNCPFSAERNPSWEAELMVGAGHEIEKAGGIDRAEKTYMAAAEVDPASLLAFFALAELELKKQQWSEAIRMYEKADQIFETHRKACDEDHSAEYLAAKYNLGLLYLQTGALESCLQVARSMEEQFPGRGDPFVLKAHVYRRMSRPEAEENFRLALEQSPELVDAYTGLIDLLLSENRVVEARATADLAGRNRLPLPPATISSLDRAQP